MQPTLLILAAGMASRYGSMKQIQSFGPGGETIMDYSVYDAIREGFGKIVFIIRKEFYENFSAIFNEKLKGKAEVEYVFQELDSYTNGYNTPAERTKPWGTAHAVLCAKEAVKEPFAVINADDFYGRNAFKTAADFLRGQCDENNYGIVGYTLEETLSGYGTVNRGVCKVDANNRLIAITERLNISKQGSVAVCDDGIEPGSLPLNSNVSMNFWCFSPSYFEYAQGLFETFLQQNGAELKSE